MKYLVTGGAGFIGFHTAKRLLDEGKEVVVIDNFNPYYDPKLKRDRAALLKGAKIYEYDISDFQKVNEVFKAEKFDKVIHLAACAGVRYSMENPWEFIKSNILGTLNIFEACKQNNVKDVVYASSSSVYGGATKLPSSESDNVDFPISVYAETKRDNELLAWTYHKMFGLNLTGLRFFTVYGPYGRPDMAAWLFADAIRNKKPLNIFNYGKQKRDFTYVADIVDGILKASDKAYGYDVFNLGNDNPTPLMRFVELVEENMGAKGEHNMMPRALGDVDETRADLAKVKKMLGWQPKVEIEEGMKNFITWFKEYKGVK